MLTAPPQDLLSQKGLARIESNSTTHHKEGCETQTALQDTDWQEMRWKMAGQTSVWEQGPERVIYPTAWWEEDRISSLTLQLSSSLPKALLSPLDQELLSPYTTAPCCPIQRDPAQEHHTRLQGWAHS